jgi:hypothetical protein
MVWKIWLVVSSNKHTNRGGGGLCSCRVALRKSTKFKPKGQRLFQYKLILNHEQGMYILQYGYT